MFNINISVCKKGIVTACDLDIAHISDRLIYKLESNAKKDLERDKTIFKISFTRK